MTLTVHVGPRPLPEMLAELRGAGIADPCPDCFTPRVGGSCKPCAVQAVFNADSDYRTWADAHARLDFGAWAPDSDQPYTLDDAQADRATVARLEAKFARAERDARTEPNACATCHEPAGQHRVSRWHAYEPPSNSQRLARMYARRAKRVGLPVWSRPKALPSCPYCRTAVPGLLASCWRPACLRAEIAAEVAYERSLDV